jgi:glycosyltransferase involved in cell wall biosynthesis
VNEEAGILVPAGDAKAFADALVRMATDAGLRARSGRAAQRRVLSRYGAERLLGDIDALYGELTAARKPAVV